MFHLVKRNAVKNQKSYRRSHLLADEIVKQDLPLVFPGVRCQGKSIKGADVHINFRPKAKTVRLKVSTKSETIKQAQQTNKPNKHEQIKKTKIIIFTGGNLVMISTLESSMGAGAEMEACLACWFGFVSCQVRNYSDFVGNRCQAALPPFSDFQITLWGCECSGWYSEGK